MIAAIAATELAGANKVQMPVNDGPSQAAEAFRSILNNIHNDVSHMSVGQAGEIAGDRVEQAKSDLLPSPWKSSIPDLPLGSTAALRQSFDHALMVTLVSQVISGVGQSVNTLIRQP